MASRLLIVEDDDKTVRALASGLTREGFAVSTARTGEEGFFLLNTESVDLVVLDWMLPGRDGVEILKALRARGARMPVLLLTAREAGGVVCRDRRRGLGAVPDDSPGVHGVAAGVARGRGAGVDSWAARGGDVVCPCWIVPRATDARAGKGNGRARPALVSQIRRGTVASGQSP
jgi:CheY-like chemotaxis protein